MYLFGAMQETNSAKLPVFLLKLIKTVCKLRVDGTKIDTEIAFNRNYFGRGVNNK